MFGFTNIPELVSPPPLFILKTHEGRKDKSCVFVFRYSYPSPHTHTNVWCEYQDRLKFVGFLHLRHLLLNRVAEVRKDKSCVLHFRIFEMATCGIHPTHFEFHPTPIPPGGVL